MFHNHRFLHKSSFLKETHEYHWHDICYLPHFHSREFRKILPLEPTLAVFFSLKTLLDKLCWNPPIYPRLKYSYVKVERRSGSVRCPRCFYELRRLFIRDLSLVTVLANIHSQITAVSPPTTTSIDINTLSAFNDCSQNWMVRPY